MKLDENQAKLVKTIVELIKLANELPQRSEWRVTDGISKEKILDAAEFIRLNNFPGSKAIQDQIQMLLKK